MELRLLPESLSIFPPYITVDLQEQLLHYPGMHEFIYRDPVSNEPVIVGQSTKNQVIIDEILDILDIPRKALLIHGSGWMDLHVDYEEKLNELVGDWVFVLGVAIKGNETICISGMVTSPGQEKILREKIFNNLISILNV